MPLSAGAPARKNRTTASTAWDEAVFCLPTPTLYSGDAALAFFHINRSGGIAARLTLEPTWCVFRNRSAGIPARQNCSAGISLCLIARAALAKTAQPALSSYIS